jgi:hypothetical protein
MNKITISLLLFLISVFNLGISHAVDPKDMGGWEQGGVYDRHYNPKEREKIRCFIKEIKEIIPMPGMSPGVGIVMDEGDGETFLVHLCPTWYKDVNSTGLKRGEKVKVRGAWAEINGEDVLMAAKIKKGDYFELKVRLSKDGKPFWAMTKEELANELQ